MEFGASSLLLMAVLGLLLLSAGIEDARTREIANWKNAAIALLALPWWWANDLSGVDMAWQLGVALIVFALFFAAFVAGQMGGGDVKMIGGVMLWIPLPLFIPMLTLMAIGGGILSAVMLIHSKIRPSDKMIEVPYGVAIAAAGLWALHQHYLNQFQFIAVS